MLGLGLGLTVTVAAYAQDATVVPTADEGQETGSDIVVTATRRPETLSKVPISITAFSQKELETRGVRQFSDIVQLTPGLSFQKSPIGGNQIAIRGISSGAGAATTGIYIDDTPIQSRNLGYAPSTTLPALFDVERIEVLRGPQGTLFGAGSQGGTIRFIQTGPSLTATSYRARAEVGFTENGAPSYEAGVAIGAPIVDDRIGFRASAYYRRNGGWIDNIDGTFTVVDPTAASYGKSIAFDRTSIDRKNVNSDTALFLHGAIVFAPVDDLKLTASMTYQKLHNDDGPDSFWLATSDPSRARYTRPIFRRGDPATNSALTPLFGTDMSPGNDRFLLPALRADLDMGFATLTSNTSYFDRSQDQIADYTRYYMRYLTQDPVPSSGFKAISDFRNTQKNFVQEVRLQSAGDTVLQWVVGGFYSRNTQRATQLIGENFAARLPVISFGGVPYGVTDGTPFGTGASAFLNTFGADMLPGSVSYDERRRIVETQFAGFTQIDVRATERLKLTAGVRVARNKLDLDIDLGGPESNINAPYGAPCFVFAGPGGSCVPGQGALAPVFPSLQAAKNETSVTTKFGVSYQLASNLLYATAAKGFRPGGAGSVIPPNVCDADFTRLGYSSAPTTYDSDHVWSYELGSKSRLLNGRLTLDGSVYVIKWSNIQTSFGLPSCGYSFVDNGGNATARGFDMGFEMLPVTGLKVSGSVAYTKSTFDEDVTSGSNIVFVGGSGVPGASAPWNVALSGNYDFEPVRAVPFYARLDYSYTSRQRRAGETQPGGFNYLPLARQVPSFSMLNARLGARTGGFDVSLFVKNITNAHPFVTLGSGSFIPNDPAWVATTFRPRTFGVTIAVAR